MLQLHTSEPDVENTLDFKKAFVIGELWVLRKINILLGEWWVVCRTCHSRSASFTFLSSFSFSFFLFWMRGDIIFSTTFLTKFFPNISVIFIFYIFIPIPPHLPLWQLSACSLNPRVCFSVVCLFLYLFSDSTYKKIIWYLSFSFWLIWLCIIFFRSIHVVANSKISFFFIEEYCYLSTYHLYYKRNLE